jgi:hypothetical protein
VWAIARAAAEFFLFGLRSGSSWAALLKSSQAIERAH